MGAEGVGGDGGWGKFKFNVNQNENENKNASGGTCEGGAKRPPVGCFTRCALFLFFVLIYVEFEFDFLPSCAVRCVGVFPRKCYGLDPRKSKFPQENLGGSRTYEFSYHTRGV